MAKLFPSNMTTGIVQCSFTKRTNDGLRGGLGHQCFPNFGLGNRVYEYGDQNHPTLKNPCYIIVWLVEWLDHKSRHVEVQFNEFRNLKSKFASKWLICFLEVYKIAILLIALK